MLLLLSLSATCFGISSFNVFFVQNLIKNILAVPLRCRYGICFFVIAHHLVFRVCTKQTSNYWNHDCLFLQKEGRCGDVFPVLMF